MKNIRQIIHFLRVDIWRLQREDLTALRYFPISVLKKLLLAVEWFTTKRVMSQASALTYSTLLAIVPMSAVVFAVARGFGYSKYIEEWFRDLFNTQPEVADVLIEFVNSYLEHTKSGVIFGLGLVFMVWTVVMLTSNIENTFNDIWQVNKSRSIYRTFADYLAMFLLVPIFIILSSGLNIMFVTVIKEIEDYFMIKGLYRVLISLTPYLLTSIAFTALYVFMPNTKVRVRNAIAPGFLAGMAMQILQLIYIRSQLWVTGYNAIYGSFAMLPLFMLWLQFSWTICLFGAELCYTGQNLEDFAFRARTEELSHRYKLVLCSILMSAICKRFAQGRPPYTALQLKLETHIPIRITHDLLNLLVRVGMLTAVQGDNHEEPVYQPAKGDANMSVGNMIDCIESENEGASHFNIDYSTLNPAVSRQLLENRKQYLSSQRAILLRDL